MLNTLAPGLAAILATSRAGAVADLRAGLSVAAVALPSAIAFAGLMGLPAEAGLHASILPMAAYALLGPSRRLVVAADTATCVLVAGSLSAVGLVDPLVRAAAAQVLAVLAGVLCLGAALLRLGAIADFLSWPILVGFLNGVALDLMLGQLPRMLAVTPAGPEAWQRLLALARDWPDAHLPTAAVGFATLALLLAMRRFGPRIPGALVACLAAGAASALLDLGARGVATVGAIPAAFPGLALPDIPLQLLATHRYELAEHGLGIALISFASFMIPARAFAARRGESTDADHEAAALGIAHVTAGFAQGFPVSASSTRTAVAEAAGAQGPLCALTAAAGMAAAMAFAGPAIAVLPQAAMAALMVHAAVSLIDPGAVRALWRIARSEAVVSLVATLGVLAAGPLNAVLVSVALAIIRFIRITARPSAEVLGRVPGLPGFHGVSRQPDAVTEPGLVLFRFNAPLVFFNAPAFARAASQAAAAPGLRWFVLDLYPITQVDSTGIEALRTLHRQLAERGVHLAFAGRMTETLAYTRRRGLLSAAAEARLYPTLRAALRAFRVDSAAATDGSQPQQPGAQQRQ
jgi:MFS superfamily sulfate permease-like transporter